MLDANPISDDQSARLVIDLRTPMFQAVGGQLYRLLVETVANQVKMSDGVTVETRVNTLERALSSNTTTRFADDIAARDKLTGLIPGDRVYVTDATADPTVKNGGAFYIWMPASGDRPASWKKLSEDESVDFILSWDKLEGRPESGTTEIDLAVSQRHAHANKTELDFISDDGADNLLYKGKRINDGKVDVASTTDAGVIPENLRDGGLLIVNPAGA